MFRFTNFKYKLYIFSWLTLLFVLAGSGIFASASEFTYPDDPYNDALWAVDNPGYYTHY